MRYLASLLLAFTYVILVFLVTLPSQIYAAGSVTLSPATTQTSSGETVSQDITISTGEDTVNAVQVALQYPTDKLNLISINSSGSAFPVGITANGGNGVIQISRGVLGQGIYGNNKLVATITFRVAKEATGSAAISVNKETVLVRSADQQNIFRDSSGSVITIAASNLTPTSSPASAGLSISDVRASGITYNKATIRWTTNIPATSFVEYGLTKAYGFSLEDDKVLTDHAMVLPEDVLVPGTVYHFRVKSTDQNQKTVTSESTTFTTIGAGVAIQIVDSKGEAIPGAKIVASTPQNSFVQTTNENGVATFANMPPTKIDILTEVKGKKQTSTIAVKEPSKNVGLKQQNYIVRVAGIQKNNSTPIILGIGIIIAIFAAVAFVLIRKKNHTKMQQRIPQPPLQAVPEIPNN